jgi:hypothetical protein
VVLVGNQEAATGSNGSQSPARFSSQESLLRDVYLISPEITLMPRNSSVDAVWREL